MRWLRVSSGPASSLLLFLSGVFLLRGVQRSSESENIFQPEMLLSISSTKCQIKTPVAYVSSPDDHHKAPPELWCTYVYATKGADYLQQLKNRKDVLSAESTAAFSWIKLDNTASECFEPTCEVHYDGYRGLYKISPDFGLYSECASVLQAYVHQLTNLFRQPQRSRSTAVFKPTDRGSCPIKQLPLSYDQYLACTMVSDAWYLIRFRSQLDVEWRNNTKQHYDSTQWWVTKTQNQCQHQDVVQIRLLATNCSLEILLVLNEVTPFSIRVNVSVTTTSIGTQDTTVMSMTELLTENRTWVVRKLPTTFYQNMTYVCCESTMIVVYPLSKKRIITANPSVCTCVTEKLFCIESRGRTTDALHLVVYILTGTVVLGLAGVL